MDFKRPASADYANVRSLNRTFLGMLREHELGAAQRVALPSMIRPQVLGLTDLQLERLSGCPFLLPSFREYDADFWQRLLADEPTGDLWAEPPGAVMERVVTAGLAFLWQLARRNPFAVRLISGASIAWCEQLADVNLIDLLQALVSSGSSCKACSQNPLEGGADERAVKTIRDEQQCLGTKAVRIGRPELPARSHRGVGPDGKRALAGRGHRKGKSKKGEQR